MLRVVAVAVILLSVSCRSRPSDQTPVSTLNSQTTSTNPPASERIDNLLVRMNKVIDANMDLVFSNGALITRLDLLCKMTGVQQGRALIDTVESLETLLNVTRDPSRPSLIDRIKYLQSIAKPRYLAQRSAFQSSSDFAAKRVSLNNFFGDQLKDFQISKTTRAIRVKALCLAMPQAQVPESDCSIPVRGVDSLERFFGIIPAEDASFDQRIADLELKVVEPTPDLYWLFVSELKMSQIEAKPAVSN